MERQTLMIIPLLLAVTVLAPTVVFALDEAPEGWIEKNCVWSSDLQVTCTFDYDAPIGEQVTVDTGESDLEEISSVETGTIEPVQELTPPEPVRELTPKEKAIEQLQTLKDRDNIQPSENEVLRLLLEAQKRCEFGIDEGEAIQTYQYFDIPVSQVDITRSFNYDRNHLLSSLAKLIESCDAWTQYKSYGLGPEYTNKVIADKDAVEDELERLSIQQSRSYSYDTVITEHDLIKEAQDAFNALCETEGQGRALQIVYGCESVPDAPNRGGYVDVSDSPIMQAYWRAQQGEDIAEKPRNISHDYVGPDTIAYQYYQAYGYLPEEMQQELTNEQLLKLLEKIKESLETE